MSTLHCTTRQHIYHDQLQRLAEAPPVWLDPDLIRAGLPYAAATRQPCTGINALLLWSAAGSPPATAWRVRPIHGPAGGMNRLRADDGVIVRWVQCLDRRRLVVRIVEPDSTAPPLQPPPRRRDFR